MLPSTSLVLSTWLGLFLCCLHVLKEGVLLVTHFSIWDIVYYWVHMTGVVQCIAVLLYMLWLMVWICQSANWPTNHLTVHDFSIQLVICCVCVVKARIESAADRNAIKDTLYYVYLLCCGLYHRVHLWVIFSQYQPILLECLPRRPAEHGQAPVGFCLVIFCRQAKCRFRALLMKWCKSAPLNNQRCGKERHHDTRNRYS